MRKTSILFILTICLIQASFAQDMPATSHLREYLLAPGDEIVVRLLGEKDFDFEAILDENGNIAVPFFEDPVPAMCKNERELRSDIAKLLSKYLRAPVVSLTIKDRYKNRPPTTIYGAVRTPQQVVLARQYRLSELLAVAGGETEDAGGMVQVVRPYAPICGSSEEISEWKAQLINPETLPIRIYSLEGIKRGTNESNPIIYPGDIIEIQSAKPVYLIGEVKGGQGGVLIKENGLTLFSALSKVGGPNREAKTKEIKIYRQKADGHGTEVLLANYDLIRKGEQKDIPLQPYDVVEVDKAKKSVGQLMLEIATGSMRTAATTFSTSGSNRIIY